MKSATPTTIKLGLPLLLLVAGCGEQPVAVETATADEARALNDAAEMLDERANAMAGNAAR